MPVTYRASSAASSINLGPPGAASLVAGGIIAATHHCYEQLLLYLGINLHIR